MIGDCSSVLTLNLDALADNYVALKRQAGGAEVAPVVKADAYGLGAAHVARRLWDLGARRFFVARVKEGENLRSHLGPSRAADIFVLDGCPPGTASRLVATGLTPVLNSLEQIAEWMNNREPRRAAIHIDTGINRLGLAVEEAYGAADTAAWSSLQVELVLSHLACATTPEHVMNQAQRGRFEALSGLWPTAQRSLSNTAGIYLGGAYRHNVVRPGVGLYGGGPFERPHSDLRPVVTFCAPILQIRRISPGESVGYGAAWRAKRATTVAIVAAGYADGVLRALGSAGYGWLAGRVRPFLGRISMDLIALDVTDCPAAHPGAMVELLGDNVLLNDVASRAQTAPYEILTAIGRRAQRVVVGAQ